MSHMTEALNTCEISQSLMFGGISSALQIGMTKLEARAKKNITNPPSSCAVPNIIIKVVTKGSSLETK